MREKTIAVDLDGTLATLAWPELGTLQPGAREALTRLANAGWQIIIYTARLYDGEGLAAERSRVAAWLARERIPYQRIEAKLPALHYVDDRAVRYGGGREEWGEIADGILGAASWPETAQAERRRALGIVALAYTHGLPRSVVEEMIGSGMSVAAAQGAAIAQTRG